MHNCDSTRITKPGNAKRQFRRAALAAAVAAETFVRTKRFRRYLRRRWSPAVALARELAREVKFLLRHEAEIAAMRRKDVPVSPGPLSSSPAPTPSIPSGPLDAVPTIAKDP